MSNDLYFSVEDLSIILLNTIIDDRWSFLSCWHIATPSDQLDWIELGFSCQLGPLVAIKSGSRPTNHSKTFELLLYLFKVAIGISLNYDKFIYLFLPSFQTNHHFILFNCREIITDLDTTQLCLFVAFQRWNWNKFGKLVGLLLSTLVQYT